MKVTVVATVLNNGDTVHALVDSLFRQSRAPDEVVVVDGGSKDNTLAVLLDYQVRHDNLKVLSKKLNKAQGRNYGIEEATHPIIAQIDGSCIAHKHWLKRLVRPMRDREVGVSAGLYKIVAENAIARAVSPFIGITPKILDPRVYMPTGRSMAIRKKVWRELHGYSEDLQWSGEDNLFNYKLLKKQIQIARVPEAFVYWHAPKSFRECIKKIFAYTAGIAQTGTWRHPCESLATVNINIPSVYLRWFLGVFFFILSFYSLIFLYITTLGVTLYFFGSLYSRREEVDDQASLMLVPVIQVLADLSTMAGFASGFVMPARRHKRLLKPAI
jgi:glycosyltransferase involved in cell wall biosynthesis